ncbi:hypothetical protein [Devosia nitrariae]|uniref:hypothetical protein n=1 Tax=Devosia nitrariae TaxID=2071872 RepID=UPI0024E10D49|nr:hypothetical protein [Devosia nitrariae]
MTERRPILHVDGAHCDRIRSAVDTSFDIGILGEHPSGEGPVIHTTHGRGGRAVTGPTLSAPPSIAPRSELLGLGTAFAGRADHLDALTRTEG